MCALPQNPSFFPKSGCDATAAFITEGKYSSYPGVLCDQVERKSNIVLVVVRCGLEGLNPFYVRMVISRNEGAQGPNGHRRRRIPLFLSLFGHTHTHTHTYAPTKQRTSSAAGQLSCPEAAPRQELRTRVWCGVVYSVVLCDERAQDETDICSQSSSGPEPRKLIGSGAVTRRNTHTHVRLHAQDI